METEQQGSVEGIEDQVDKPAEDKGEAGVKDDGGQHDQVQLRMGEQPVEDNVDKADQVEASGRVRKLAQQVEQKRGTLLPENSS